MIIISYNLWMKNHAPTKWNWNWSDYSSRIQPLFTFGLVESDSRLIVSYARPVRKLTKIRDLFSPTELTQLTRLEKTCEQVGIIDRKIAPWRTSAPRVLSTNARHVNACTCPRVGIVPVTLTFAYNSIFALVFHGGASTRRITATAKRCRFPRQLLNCALV